MKVMDLNEIKLVVCDIDGTITEKGEDPQPITLKALKRFHDEGIMLVSSQSGYRLPLGKLGRSPMEETLVNPAVKVVEKLMENRYTKDQIVRSLMEEYGIAPANLYWLLNQFWKQGLIVDSRFF